MLIFHLIVAVLSLAFTTYLYFFPSNLKLQVGEGLVLATLVSGMYLVFSTPTNMLQVCMTGLVYIAVVSVGLVSARNKLAKLGQN